MAAYDTPLLPPIHFVGPLEILGNMNFERANDFNLDELLLNRVTLDSPQQLEGHVIFSRDLNIEGKLNVQFSLKVHYYGSFTTFNHF